MPLDRPGEVSWFEIGPCYVFHVGNAYDAAGRIVVDVARYSREGILAAWEVASGAVVPAGRSGPAAAAATAGFAFMRRWTIDPAAGTVGEAELADRAVEFPTVDDDRAGRHGRFLYAVSGVNRSAAIVQIDGEQGGSTAHELGPDVVAGEAVFVPSAAPDRAEDDGWLLSITTRRDGSASQLLVLDATDVAGKPVAAVTLPRGVPAGFHGSWIPDPAA